MNLSIINKPDVFKLYRGKVELMFDPAKHLYTEKGEVVDGVTSVLQTINKPALVYWAANMAASYIDANLPIGRPIDEIEKQKLVEGCKKAHRVKLEDAGNLGTMLHKIIEDFANGKNPDDPFNPILKKSFADFKGWVKDKKIKFVDSERKIYSRKHRYAGTLDHLAKSGDLNILIDIKTSSGIWDEYILQLVAYAAAFLEEFPTAKIDKVVIVRCGKDGAFEVKEIDYAAELKAGTFKAFLGLLALHRRLKQMKFNNSKGGCK